MAKSSKPKSQKHNDNAEKKTGRARSLQNLIPFQTGYDPRRNYHGRPKDIDQLRELVRDIGQHEIELKGGQKISRLYLKVLEMFGSKDPRDNALILQYGFGKVPDEMKLHTWQDEIIQALHENLITSIDVIKVLGLEDARPILIAAGASFVVDSSETQTVSRHANESIDLSREQSTDSGLS